VTLHSIVDGVITTTPRLHRVSHRSPSVTWLDQCEAEGKRLGEVYRVVDERTGKPVETLPLTACREPRQESRSRCGWWTATT